MVRKALKITPDTNLLVRIAVRDDTAQARLALKTLKEAEVVAISTLAFCELVWVLQNVYKFVPKDISMAISNFAQAPNVVVDRVAVDVGVAVVAEGADFADGIIALEGARLGGETFVSFDKKAVACLTALGRPSKSVN